MKGSWRHDRVFTVPTHARCDAQERLMGFVRKQTMDGYIEHWFARAYVSYTHENGFFVKTLAEGKALVDDMLEQEHEERRSSKKSRRTKLVLDSKTPARRAAVKQCRRKSR